jgi:hypothetical protein
MIIIHRSLFSLQKTSCAIILFNATGNDGITNHKFLASAVVDE